MKSDTHWMPARITRLPRPDADGARVRDHARVGRRGRRTSRAPTCRCRCWSASRAQVGCRRAPTRWSASPTAAPGASRSSAWTTAAAARSRCGGWPPATGCWSASRRATSSSTSPRPATCWWPAASASRRWSSWRSGWARWPRAAACRAHALRRAQRRRAGLPAAAAGGAGRCEPQRPGPHRQRADRLRRRDRGAAAAAASSTPAARCRCSKPSSAPGRRPAAPPADLRFETFGSSGRLRGAGLRGAHPAPRPRDHVPADSTLARSARSRRRADAVGLPARRMRAVRDGRAGGRRRDRPPRRVPQRAREGSEARRICACVSRAVGTITIDSAWRPDSPMRLPKLCAMIAQTAC